jgi:hypothetical protein
MTASWATTVSLGAASGAVSPTDHASYPDVVTVPLISVPPFAVPHETQ